jgi:hypothetical protein
MTTIDIHEFSTGINIKGTKDNWYSDGFTGYYLNSTIANIPEAVRQDIAADLFELAESSIQQTPALIGREVKLGNEQWSVLAVVSSGRDYSSRILLLTRFFLTEGLGKLVDLLTYQQTNNLKFDPFDQKQLNQPNQYNTNSTREIDILPRVFDDYSSIVNNLLANSLIVSTRLTNKNQKIPIKAIHQLAQEKSKLSGKKLITWAYNVEGLKKPYYFLVIYSASSQADQYLYQSFQVKQPQVQSRKGEYQIVTVIQNWILPCDIQIDDILVINNALNDPNNYDKDFWQQLIFNNLGIKNINDQYSPYNIRLYLLYSLIFPKELSNLLKWLHKKNNGKNLDAEHYQIAIEFSQKLQSTLTSSNQLEPLQIQAFQGIDLIITNLVNLNNGINDSLLADWLILDQMGIWGQVYHQFYKKELWNDIEQIAINKQNLGKTNQQFGLLNTKSWKTITQDLTALINNQKNHQSNLKYLPLAQFFETLGDDTQSPPKINYTLSAIFYSLATGFVPNTLWKRLDLPPKKVSARLTTIVRQDIEIITIHRKLTQAETFTRNLSTIISSVFKPVTVPFILLPTLFAIGLISGVAISKTILFQQNFPTPKPSISPKPSPTPKPSISPKPVPTFSLETSPSSKSEKDWRTTSKNLDSLRDEFVKGHKDKKLTSQKVESAIIQALSLRANYEYKNGHPEVWIGGIQKFQDKTGANYSSDEDYGYIHLNDPTYNHLKCEVAKNLKITLKNPPSECSSDPN